VGGRCAPRRSLRKGIPMLQAVITALPILILKINKDGIILEFTSDSPSFFGIRLDSFLNNHLNSFFPKQAESDLAAALFSINNGEQPPVFNYAVTLEDGEHWFEARFMNSGNETSIVIIQDTTKYRISEIKIQKQLDQMSALRAIDHAITSSFDLNATLSILLAQLVKHLGIDAACILLWNTDTNRLEFAAGLGFTTDTFRYTKLRLGEGYAGIVALERKTIQKDNISDRKTDFLRSPTFLKEKFVSYFGVPLVAKGQVKGVLEIFNRTKLCPPLEWVSFLEMLGGQAAIAVDNASLFNDLQRSNIELTSAYDATIEGWSRALEIRDHDTEGHTKRVVEMTIELARKIGIPEKDIIHIQRGAALHDIGKMGIPDYILYKPSSLSEEEWHIMRQHPQHACALLSPIEYLRPAREIPCYHHERWNGSGYPAGLKEERIPLPARLFAVIDVYDALTSDRPYRPAWSEQAAIEYIQNNSGELFDPNVVPVFLEMLKEDILSTIE